MEWLDPWYSVENDAAQVNAMQSELYRELKRGHPLFGVAMRTLARREDNDDVLFSLEDGARRVAVVHLTWAENERPPWPATVIFASFEDWLVRGLQPDHEEFRAE